MAERSGDLWTEAVSTEKPGVVHIRGEYVCHGADWAEVAEIARWWRDKVHDKTQGGQVLLMRGLSIDFGHEFDRDDLTVKCYVRMSVLR